MNRYAISDIHGCLKTFESLLKLIDFSKNDELYLLGDLIDRGPNSKGVIDLIWKLQKSGHIVCCLRGNHDQMMLEARRNYESLTRWLEHGGEQTLYSFDAQSISGIPEKYFEFIDDMPTSIELDAYLFVHAGLNFALQNPLQDEHAMMWQRNWYNQINYDWLGNRVIIHGHTPLPKNEISAMQKTMTKQQYLDIDGGCVHKGNRAGQGFLSCLVLGENQLIFEKNRDF